MTEEETSTVEQIVEYESQLISIVQLLEASPDDESLLVLKKDMEELLELSRATIESESSPPQPVESNTQLNEASGTIYRPHPNVKQETATETVPPIDTATTFNDDGSSGGGDEIVASMKKAPPQKVKKRKKHKKVKEFTLPSHLIPNEEDTETERNKKRRAAKSLKDQWRHQRKEIESENRQKSWQSFQKKTVGKRVVDDGTGSIFATQEGVNDRVGVVSKKQKTEFGARKRHT